MSLQVDHAAILIVEDNDKNMKLVRDVLQAKGYATIEAGHRRGRRPPRAASTSPTLILMDIQLPGINGIEALRQLRADPATASIPVIAVTASVMAAGPAAISPMPASTATSASRSASRNSSTPCARCWSAA